MSLRTTESLLSSHGELFTTLVLPGLQERKTHTNLFFVCACVHARRHEWRGCRLVQSSLWSQITIQEVAMSDEEAESCFSSKHKT